MWARAIARRSLAWGREERAAALSAAVAGRGASDEYPDDLLTYGRTDGGSHVRDWVWGLGGESETPEAQSISYGEVAS